MMAASIRRTDTMPINGPEEGIKHVQVRLPQRKYNALRAVGITMNMNMQELTEYALDRLLARPESAKARDLAGIKEDPQARMAYFLEHANPYFLGAVMNIVEAFFATQTGRKRDNG